MQGSLTAARGASIAGRPQQSLLVPRTPSPSSLLRAAPARPAALPAAIAAPRRLAVRARAAPDATVIDDVEAAPAPVASSAAAGSAAAPASPDAVKLRLRLRSYDKDLLARACRDVTAIAAVSGAKVSGPVFLPTKRRIYCVLRSPHVDKDSREHFEVRTHHRLVDLSNLSAQTLSALMEYVPPSGIELQTKLC
jgi:small subunit ribosomal protein S10